MGATLPPMFDAWFSKATALDPKDRFPSATELVAALAQALNAALPRSSLPSLSVMASAVTPSEAPLQSSVQQPAINALEVQAIGATPESSTGTSDLPTVPLRRADEAEHTTTSVVSRDMAPLRPRRWASAVSAALVLATLVGNPRGILCAPSPPPLSPINLPLRRPRDRRHRLLRLWRLCWTHWCRALLAPTQHRWPASLYRARNCHRLRPRCRWVLRRQLRRLPQVVDRSRPLATAHPETARPSRPHRQRPRRPETSPLLIRLLPSSSTLRRRRAICHFPRWLEPESKPRNPNDIF